MSRPSPRRVHPLVAGLAGLVVLALAATALAQLAVRPDDPMGVSIRESRVRVIHSSTAEVPGTSMHLQQTDPWLAYQRGRSYFFREWNADDGVFNALPRRPQASATTSCGMCHNLPFGTPGSGGNVSAPVGIGRNAPHLFGAGLLETLAMQIRAQAYAELDTNRNGYLDIPEETAGKRLVVEARPGVKIDYGSFDDADGNRRPDLNYAVLVRMVLEDGQRVLVNDQGRFVRMGDPGVVGMDIQIGAFASSAGDHQFPALRVFAVGVLNNIMGILPAVEVEDAAPLPGYWWNGWARPSNGGALQSDLLLTHDPSKTEGGDGTITVGELDLFEWYMANHPPPALGPQNDETRRGRRLMVTMGCTSCHVADWQILPADEELGLPGDRRFFHLEVAHNPQTDRMEGRLEQLTVERPGPDGQTLELPAGGGFLVRDVYTDLLHHDLGERFWEFQYSRDRIGAVKMVRTPPLWGVGSSAPYGHDGMSPTLDDVIRRHGGEAEASAEAYRTASVEDREAVVEFLRSLQLYQPDFLPTDVDGDGTISDRFKVAGREVGQERFQPELLFDAPPRYRGWVEGPDGDRFFSYELLNVAEAYGAGLEALVDRDGDTVPDLLQAPDDLQAGTEATTPADREGRR